MHLWICVRYDMLTDGCVLMQPIGGALRLFFDSSRGWERFLIKFIVLLQMKKRLIDMQLCFSNISTV